MSNKMDAWYEEDEQVFVHPSVKVNGEVVAETDRSMILFETPRWRASGRRGRTRSGRRALVACSYP
jgi:hypothetical protein